MRLAFRRAVWLPPLLSFAGLSLVLELGLGLAETPSYLMPRPSEVFLALYVHGAELTRAILRTTLAASAGLLASTLLGVVLGWVCWTSGSVIPAQKAEGSITSIEDSRPAALRSA